MAAVASGYLDGVHASLAGIAPWSGTAPRGFTANSLGVFTSVEWTRPFIPAQEYATVSAGSRHVDTAHRRISDGESFFEHAAIITAVRAARERFTMIEAGAGWGARCVDAGRLLQLLSPMPCFLTAVEAVPGYYAWLRQHFATNGLDPDQHWLVNAAVSHDNYGKLMRLTVGMLGNQLFDYHLDDLVARVATDPATAGAVLKQLAAHSQLSISADGQDFPVAFVSCLRLGDLLAPLPLVDYLDMDIQHAEMTVVPQAIDMLDRRVRLMHLGTHSHGIHVALTALFQRHGWEVLAEFAPDAEHECGGERFRTGDGVLTVRNPRL